MLIYPAMVVAWLIAERSKYRFRFWVGVLAILSAAPFFMMLGGFLGTFHNNICYSDVVQSLAETSASYANHAEKKEFTEWAEKIQHLPLRGYETDCAELMQAVDGAKGNLSEKP